MSGRQAAKRRRVLLVHQTHWDVEVFMSASDTLAIGVSNMALVLRLLEENPAYTFTFDQGCYLSPAFAMAPGLREPLMRHAGAGRVEVAGGTWTMPDLNIPCGESFLGNVQRGLAFFSGELGLEAPLSWTLDCFGHPPSFPQLARGCGFEANVFGRVMEPGSPTDFRWRGIDGTELRSHFLSGGYAALWPCPATFPEFRELMDDRLAYHAERANTDSLLLLMGGDNAAPDAQVIGFVAEYNRVQDRYEIFFSTPSRYIEAIAAECAGTGKDLPVVEGDLNPVFTGCYSARIRVKQRNRELETLLLDAEKLEAMVAWTAGPGDAPEPRTAPPSPLLDAWEPVVFNQFHDIICGSHVDLVYRATLERFAIAEHLARARQSEELAALASRIDTSGDGIPIIVFNTLGHARSEAVEVPLALGGERLVDIEVRDSSAALVPCDVLSAERYGDGSIRAARILFVARNLPPLGWEVYRVLPAGGRRAPTDLATSEAHRTRDNYAHGWIESSFARVSVDLWSGAITGLRVAGDSAGAGGAEGWEAIPAGSAANVVTREQDFGNFWQYNGPCKGDAHRPLPSRDPLPDRHEPSAIFSDRFHGDGAVIRGNARVEIAIDRPFGSGHHATRVRLTAGSPRVDIVTTVENQEERVRYRAAFPTTLAGGAITHEIPFGAIERPEGEYPAQGWIDLSKDGRGLALLNRGLPGNAVVDGVLLLSLLKCTALKEGYGDVSGFPDTSAGYEKGVRHVFEYALLPHAGDWRSARLWQAGQELNTPAVVRQAVAHAGELPARLSLLKLSHPELALSALKRNGDGVVVRVYEASGRAIDAARIDLDASVLAAAPPHGASRPLEVFAADLLERPGTLLATLDPRHGTGFSFPIGGFGIRTFLVRPARDPGTHGGTR